MKRNAQGASIGITLRMVTDKCPFADLRRNGERFIRKGRNEALSMGRAAPCGSNRVYRADTGRALAPFELCWDAGR